MPHQLTASISSYPARASLAWYLALIAVGSLLLAMPFARASDEKPISALDAVFTATSASCVTGLAVRTTDEFSWAGQLVILCLIQLGGVGIMTVTTFLMFRFGGRQNLRARAVISETLGAHRTNNLPWILANVLRLTFILESAGFLALLTRNLVDLPLPQAAWHALFHSVSAFCNAGFALHSDSLVRYQGDPVVNVVICTLVVVGGLGFPVILDLIRHRHKPWSEIWGCLTLHTKLMLLGTLSLFLVGAVSFLLLEWERSLTGLGIGRSVLVACFHSITCRTAGFNTIDLAALSDAMLFISMLLMAIGAGPCSTAGGFKVSTTVILVCQAWATFRGRTRLNLFRRTVPIGTVQRATATAMLFGVVALVALTVLVVIEEASGHAGDNPRLSIEAMFEAVSALGTVGLSVGLTGNLSALGRGVLILLMILGRLGPISVFVALSTGTAHETVQYASEEPMIG
ncbi:MAG: hypothetical protein KDA61_00290 [Planctomycetales bacterium]|nr:hypothetical protein [Planctomycetales bacterium]